MVRIGPNNRLAPNEPNAVFSLRGEQISHNRLRLVWFYSPLAQKASPKGFAVYWDAGTGQIDQENPLAVLRYRGRRFYGLQTEPLPAEGAEAAAGAEWGVAELPQEPVPVPGAETAEWDAGAIPAEGEAQPEAAPEPALELADAPGSEFSAAGEWAEEPPAA